MQTKEDTAPAEETPKKRRGRAAAAEPVEAPEAAEPKKPARRRTTKDADVEAKAEPKVVAKAEPKVEKVEKAEEPAAPKKPRGRRKAETEEAAPAPVETKAAPKPEPVKVEAPKAEPKPAPVREVRPVEAAPAPVAAESAPVAPQGQQQGQQGGQQQHGQRHHRDRQRQRHEQRQQQGQQGQQGAQQQGGQQQQGQQGGQQQALGGGGQPQQQPGQGEGEGRRGRRRRRRRGGGGGGVAGGQPGQPGQLPPNLESQLQSASGILEIDDRGNGRLRRADRNFMVQDNDPEVPKQIIERYRLRPGALLQVQTLPRNGKLQVQRVDQVEGVTPDEASNRLTFANLTSVDPDRRIKLETTSNEHLTRVIDIIAPIGFGQRGLIVAPPKTGKTIILQKMAKAILTNYPKVKLMVLLIDERPEEVTDFKRGIGADVYASSSDRPAHEHLRIAELVLDRARRLVEAGDDVVVLLDSITRLARAYNKEIESSGRTMSGGVDSRALERPKRIFGAARNTEEAGSLTIIGTALVDTGSRMDEVIFEEFKGTGNMEIVLDRALAERRLFPAVNVNNSGTRKEEKLFKPKENEKIRKLRAYLAALRPIEAMEKLISRVRDFRSNDEFFDAV